jgi:hypothetical protein
MSSILAREIAGSAEPTLHLPRTAARRGAVTYLKLIRRVTKDPTWGGFAFEGELLPPGGVILETEIKGPGLLLECAGAEPGGRGHVRAPTLYLLWRYDRVAGQWREVARAASVGRDWTLDLGPIARRELEPPRPVLVDPEVAADHVLAALDKELAPLRREAQCLVVRAVYDRFAARVAAG